MDVTLKRGEGISVTLKDVKDTGGVIPIKSPFRSPLWPLQKHFASHFAFTFTSDR